MDYLSHSLSGHSQTTHHLPHLHRRSRPSALRPQGRLPRRILRRCAAHRAPANLRGRLRPLAGRRNSRASRRVDSARNFAVASNFSAPCSHESSCQLFAPSSQTSTIRTQPPQPDCRLPLLIRAWNARVRVCNTRTVIRVCNAETIRGWNAKKTCHSDRSIPFRRGRERVAEEPAVFSAEVNPASEGTTSQSRRGRATLLRRLSSSKINQGFSPVRSPSISDRQPKNTLIQPSVNFCERQMNSTCGKSVTHRRTKPVIAADTTCSVYLLTGTISGSNFAIPSNKFRLTGMRRNCRHNAVMHNDTPRFGAQPEVTRRSPWSDKLGPINQVR